METQTETSGPVTGRPGRFRLAVSVLAALSLGSLLGRPVVGSRPPHLERALAEQLRLSEERPGDAGVFNDLGNLLVLAGRLADAEAAYRRALELAPDSARVRFNLGLLLSRKGERRAALREFRRVVELDPQNAWAHYEKGKIYLSWRLERRAERSFAQAFRIDPRLADSRFNPHVLHNPVATRALLQAGRLAGSDLQAPWSFEEGGRIAGLMLSYPERKAAPESAPETQPDPGVEQGFRPGSRLEPEPPTNAPQEAPVLAKEGMAKPETRTLTSEDLDSAPRNQVVGGAANLGSDRARSKQEMFRQFQLGVGAQGPPEPVPENPIDYEPGLDSTGRLETRIEAVARIAAAGNRPL